MAPRKAIFLLNLQHHFVRDPSTRVPHADRVVHAAATILLAARELRLKYASLPSSGSVPNVFIVFVQRHTLDGTGLEHGTPGWELELPAWEEDGSELGEIVVGSTLPDPFEANPTLANRLKAFNVTEVFVAGVESESSVELTVNSAVLAGFDVTLLAGAHSTFDRRGSDPVPRSAGRSDAEMEETDQMFVGDNLDVTVHKSAVEIEAEVEERVLGMGAQVVQWEDEVDRWAASEGR